MGEGPIEAFSQRYGLHSGPRVERDFPAPARTALVHIMADLVNRGYVEGWGAVERELDRAARSEALPEDAVLGDSVQPRVESALQSLPWFRVYEVLERVYRKLLQPVIQWDMDIQEDLVLSSLDEVQEYYSQEINDLMGEEDLPFRFVDGQFHRPGRYHTQQLAAAGSKVLGTRELSEARVHFTKAQRFFEAAPTPDFPNAIKEAVSALESAARALFPGRGHKNAIDVIRSLRGTGTGEIPPALVKGMEALYAYRGSAEGVAHGGAEGGSVSAESTELALNLAASYIVYLVDFRQRTSGEAPF